MVPSLQVHGPHLPSTGPGSGINIFDKFKPELVVVVAVVVVLLVEVVVNSVTLAVPAKGIKVDNKVFRG